MRGTADAADPAGGTDRSGAVPLSGGAGGPGCDEGAARSFSGPSGWRRRPGARDDQGERVPRGTPQLHQGFEAEFPHLLDLALRVTTRLLRDRADAEDAAAEALARTARQWARIGELEYRDAWVQRVAANVAIDQLRRRRHAPEPSPEAVLDPADPLVGRLEVAELLRGLPARQREVLVLRYLLDLSTDEVSAALGISANSVKTHTTRALAALRGTRPTSTEATVAH